MHLNCHSYYSLKYGTMSPGELLHEALKKDISCFALTDINNTSGVLDFVRLSKKANIKPVVGIDFRNGAEQKFIGIAKNNEGFYELNKFLTLCLLTGEAIIPDGIPEFENAFLIYPFNQKYRLLKNNEFMGVKSSDFNKLRFSEWKNYPEKLVVLSPVTLRNDIDFNIHRLLRAIDNNTLLSKLNKSEQAQPDEIMLTENELENIYNEYPQLIRNTKKILDECEIDFEFGVNKNKKYFTGTAKQDYHKLLSLCNDGMKYRYPYADDTIIERFEKEIKLISELNFSSYFLINHDIVNYAQQRGFFYVGRGSGANSLVAYLLRITDVDPIDLDLYFERFINASRTSPPDFDIDFNSNERNEIIKHIFKTYGTAHTALLATYSTFQSRAVIRELGKVFGLPAAEIDLLVENRKSPKTSDHISKLIFRYANRINDFPSHLSIHAGGILISEKPIYYYTATNMPPKDFPLTQFSMLEAEDLGLYKFDILAQRGLGKIKDAVEIIKQNKNVEIDIHNIKRFKEDEGIRKNLTEANLMGCFYVESPGMRMLLTKLKAKTYLDLVAASSIIRPGVASSGMMREYILRFHDESRRQYIHPLMKELMEETFGVMVYQEDVIKVAHHFAKLTLTEADMLRRGMSGKYRGREEFKKVEDKFLSNCKAEGYPDEITKEVWRQIESFAGYAFSKGHSASYAVESYQCMFLKTYYPLEFMTAVINNGGGFFGVQFYVHEARMCGGKINAPDINRSNQLTTIYDDNIFLGFHLVGELEGNVVGEILNERNRNGNFTSLENFMKRVSIAVEQLRILIRIGSFRFTGRTKKQLLWDIHTIIGAEKKTVARNELFETERRNFVLPTLYHHQLDDALDELEILGFPLCNPFQLIKEKTPINFFADDLKKHKGDVIEITGYLVTTKSASTKHGEAMFFGTWLDEKGKFFDTTHFPKIAAQFPIRGRGCYRIIGKVAEEFDFYSIDLMEMYRLDNLTREDLVEKEIAQEKKF
ncbi:MAG: DNA polymerase III subunit alpha [Bacteroidia bacterium]